MQKILLNFALILSCLLLTNNSFSQSPLYYSSQTGETSSWTGNGSYTSDAHEEGSVTLSTSGSISISVNPPEFSMGPNETKSWTGTVSATGGPTAGNTESASIIGDYNLHYFGEGFDTTKVGQQTIDFTIYSIKCQIPDTTLVDQMGTVSITSTTFPSNGGSYEWTTSSNRITLTNIDQRTVEVTVVDSTAKVEPISCKFTIEGVSYTANGVVKVNDCKCDIIETGETFGPISLNFSSPPDFDSPDSDGFCSYNATNASFGLTMKGVVERGANLTQANVSFKKNCQTGEFKDVTISWNGNKAIADINFLSLKATSVSLTVDNSGNLNGTVGLNVNLNQDKNILGGLAIVKRGVTGSVNFTFSGGNDWNGDFDFGGVSNINIEIVKAGTTIAKVNNGSLGSDGSFSGTFTAVGGATYNTGGFTVMMNDLSLGVIFSISGDFEITDGNGSVDLKNMQGITGEFTLGLAFSSGNCQASISASNITAFSMTLDELGLTVDFDENFDITTIEGDLKAKHNQFDVKIEVNPFKIENGELKEFNASGNVKYKAFTFTLSDASYANSKLSLSAEVKIDFVGQGGARVAVDKFEISQGGSITVGKIEADYNKTPVKVHFDATFTSNSFNGNFSGDFANKISISGSILIGVETDFVYGSLALAIGTNIPLGNSGLKITELSGKVGFNYSLAASTPQEGQYFVGVGIKIADIADICEVGGEIIIEIGNNIVLTLNGNFASLKNNTFVSGDLNVNYSLPAEQIYGSVSTNIVVPSSGSVVQTDNLNVDFWIYQGWWRAKGQNMGGKIFDKIVMSNGAIDIYGRLSTSSRMNGTISGLASANWSDSATYPTGFNPETYWTADWSDDWAGFGFKGSYRILLSAQVRANLKQTGLNGSISVSIYASGRMDIKIPLHIYRLHGLSANGRLTVGTYNGNGWLHGNLTFNYQSYSGDVDVDLTF